MATRIYNNIHSVLQKGVELHELMCASSIFGIGLGKKKLKILCTSIPNIMSAPELNISDIEKIEGFSTKSARKIIDNMDEFKKFCKGISKHININKKVPQSQLLANKKYVFSGFRDKNLEEFIISNGGSVMTSVSSKISCLIVAGDEPSTKITKANELGIQIIQKKDFLEMYV